MSRRARRTKKAIWFLLFLWIGIRVFPLTVWGTTLGEVPEGVPDWESRLPEEIASLLPEGMASENTEELGKAAMEMTSPQWLLSVVGELVEVGWKDALRLFASLVGLLLIASVFGALRRSFSSGGVAEAVRFCSCLGIFALILQWQGERLLEVAEYLDRLSTLVGAMIPVTGAVWAMGGNVATASAGTAGLSVFITICQRLCAETVIPVCGFCTAAALCQVLSPELGLRSLAGAIKKVYTVSLGLIMTVLVASLGAQTALGTAADSAAARTAKSLSATVIPVVGGSVGDTLRTVAAGVQYLKTVLGISGIAMILLLTLPTLLSLLLARLVLLLGSGVAELLGCEEEGRLLSELGTVYGCMIAVVTMCALMFLIGLWIFVRTVVATA